MNDFNQNSPEIETQVDYSTGSSRKKRGLKALLFTLVLGGVVALGYFGYQNPELFRADLLPQGPSANIPASVKLYIPDYEAEATDSGSIAVKLRSNAITKDDEEKLVSVKFKLQYSPADALTFNANSLIFNNTTLFKSADLKSVNTSTKGEIIVSMFSSTGADVVSGLATDPTLFELAVDLKAPEPTTNNALPNPAVVVDSKINLKVSDVEVIKVDAQSQYEVSKKYTQIGADKITIKASNKNELTLLYTEVLDANHLLLKFSDLLSNPGKPTDYKIIYEDSKQKPFDGGLINSNILKEVYVPSDYTAFEDTVGKIHIYAGQNISGVEGVNFALFSSDLEFIGLEPSGSILENEAVIQGVVSANKDQITISNQSQPFANQPQYDFSEGDLIMGLEVKTKKPLADGTRVNIDFQRAEVDEAGSGQPKSLSTNPGLLIINSIVKTLEVEEVKTGPHPVCQTCDQSFAILKFKGKGQISEDFHTLDVDANQAFLYGNLQNNLARSIKTLFFGYKKPSTSTSAVKLKSIKVESPTEVLLSFDGGVDPKTATPVNIGAVATNPKQNLRISKAEAVSSNSVRLTFQNKQQSGTNYLVYFNGLKDAQNRLIPNNLILNFTGYSVPKLAVSQVKPSSVINDQDQEVVLIGENLDTLEEARLGTVKVVISNKTKGAVTLTIPKDFATGSYDINLLNRDQETQTLKNAMVVDAPKQPFRVISAESKSVPKKVAPDGKTKVKLYALIEDPVDIASVSGVTIDLSPIGGAKAVAMTKDSGAQKKGQQFYVIETTVDVKTPTQATPYKLAVQARKGAETTDGEVEIVVTQDVLKSVAPVVEQIYVNPTMVAPDGKSPVKISAKITDADGASTIKSVIADMGQMGIGFIQLKPLNVGGNASESSSAFFESAEFTVPTTTKQGKYKISVTASDDTGESTKSEIDLEVSQSVTGPRFDKDKSYIGPRKSVPNDGKTTFNINVMASDNDGVSDIDSVVAYFTSLGLKPVTLTKDPSASDAAKSALFSSADISIPTTAPTGNHQIQVVATDKTGGQGNLTLLIDVTYEDTVGDAPIVFSKKSYTTPKVALNDGKTPITLYAFVRDNDQDLDSVIVNLKGVGQVGPENPAEFGVSGSNSPSAGAGGSCPTGSNTIVCMKPSFTEGRDGQWFVLSDVTVSSRTPATNTPYEIEVIATDKARKVGRGKISVLVGDGQNIVQDKKAPELIAAVPVAPGKLEVVFDEPILSSTISSVGREFTISKQSDVNEKLNVVGATMNVEGNVVTLTTAGQVASEAYVLTVSGVQDASGIPIAPRANRANFAGYVDSKKAPVVQLVSVVDQETVEVEFQEPIRPSSVQLGVSSSSRGDHLNVKIYEAGQPSAVLPVKSVTVLDGGKVLEIKTQAQKSTQRYQLQIEGISSSGGNKLTRTINKFFKAINYRAVQSQSNASGADLNGDGKVDFIDFTLFSASYGKSFGQSTGSTNSNSGSSSQGLQPIAPNPNATVPTTSPTN